MLRIDDFLFFIWGHLKKKMIKLFGMMIKNYYGNGEENDDNFTSIWHFSHKNSVQFSIIFNGFSCVGWNVDYPMRKSQQDYIILNSFTYLIYF